MTRVTRENCSPLVASYPRPDKRVLLIKGFRSFRETRATFRMYESSRSVLWFFYGKDAQGRDAGRDQARDSEFRKIFQDFEKRIFLPLSFSVFSISGFSIHVADEDDNEDAVLLDGSGLAPVDRVVLTASAFFRCLS